MIATLGGQRARNTISPIHKDSPNPTPSARTVRRAGKWWYLPGLILGLSACGGPIDQRLTTDSTEQAYRASLDAIYPKLTKHEQEAFNWAVSGYSLAKFNATYPGTSPRAAIRAEVARVLDQYPAELSHQQRELAKLAPLRADLGRITATDTSFTVVKDFFGPQPRISALITNGSSLPVSSLRWNASLFLNNQTRPTADAQVTSDFTARGGLKPGQSVSMTFKIGFVRGDSSWSTLAIQSAGKRNVTLDPEVQSILDFSNQPYLGSDPISRAKELGEAIAFAKKFSDI